jgi:magnesium transporter
MAPVVLNCPWMRQADHLLEPVLTVAHRNVAILPQDLTVLGALQAIRQRGVDENVVYFYVVDTESRLTGVLPTRRLLTAPLDQRISDVMLTRVIAVPHTATVFEACEAFVLHKLLAFPVVDENRRIVGVVDVSLLSEEAFDIAEREQTEAMFERIGFRVSQVQDASPVRAFRFRFPWLLATITSGTICAFLAGAFEVTLARSLVLAFFLTLVLGLAESVSMQSMTVTIQALRSIQPSFRWYARAFRREMGTALLLGTASGALVGAVVWLWRGALLPAFAIGSSISIAMCAACLFGLSVPAILHRLKLDPKIAAGPVTLGLTDIFTLLFYFTLATLLL